MIKQFIKKISLFFVFLVLCFTLSSFKETSSVLEYHQKELKKEEKERISQLVFEKLGLDNYTYEVISNFNETNRYVLIEGEKCYLIFDRDLFDYAEFSCNSNSIFTKSCEKSQKIYYAPTYYFEKNEGDYFDLHSEAKLSNEALKAFRDNEAILKDKCLEKSSQQNNSPKGGQGNQIDHSYYYEKLHWNLGYNQVGACSYIAVEMIMQYYDSIYNDNIIDETYDAIGNCYFDYYSDIDVEDYNESPGVTNNFHLWMVNMGATAGYNTTPTSDTIYNIYIDDLIEDYFDLKNMNVYVNTPSFFQSCIDFCRSSIDLDVPVLIGIYGTDTNVSLEPLEHSVVGYKYDTDGIYVHFGWQGYDYTCINIHNYYIDLALNFTLDLSHSCSNNYHWVDGNYCTGTICPCGIKHCNHESTTYSQSNSTTHTYVCNSCGGQVTSPHNFYTSGSNYVCSICGYTIAINHTHSFSYIPIPRNRHTGRCFCGDVVNEPCIGYMEWDGNIYCVKCGRLMS